jgi:hypothetical protein
VKTSPSDTEHVPKVVGPDVVTVEVVEVIVELSVVTPFTLVFSLALELNDEVELSSAVEVAIAVALESALADAPTVEVAIAVVTAVVVAVNVPSFELALADESPVALADALELEPLMIMVDELIGTIMSVLDTVVALVEELTLTSVEVGVLSVPVVVTLVPVAEAEPFPELMVALVVESVLDATLEPEFEVALEDESDVELDPEEEDVGPELDTIVKACATVGAGRYATVGNNDPEMIIPKIAIFTIPFATEFVDLKNARNVLSILF